MEENERSETVLEESAQETTGKKSLTNESKVSFFLLGIALILWIFAPFVNGDLYKITALEMLAGPIFKSWTWFTEAFYGQMTYSEYIDMMSNQSRQFWVAIAAVVYILLVILACLRNNKRNAVVFSALATVAFLAPMLELGLYLITKGITIPESLLRVFFSAFGWGYWAFVVVIIAIGFVNRNKEKK